MINSSRILSTGCLIAALCSLTLFNNCGGGFESAGSSVGGSSSSSSTGGNSSSAVGNVVLSSATTSVVTELNAENVITVQIDRSGSYANKTISLDVETPEIDAIDKMDGVQITVTPQMLPPGTTTAEVRVKIGTLSPSFAEHFHLVAMDGGLVINELEVNVTVQSLFRIQVKGAGDTNWFSNGVLLTSLMDNGTRDIRFVHHNAGLQVLFENYDTSAHRVHSSGSIQHQPGSMAASADGTTVGGTYMPTAIIGNAISNAPVYLHNEEAGGMARRLTFNVDL